MSDISLPLTAIINISVSNFSKFIAESNYWYSQFYLSEYELLDYTRCNWYAVNISLNQILIRYTRSNVRDASSLLEYRL